VQKFTENVDTGDENIELIQDQAVEEETKETSSNLIQKHIKLPMFDIIKRDYQVMFGRKQYFSSYMRLKGRMQ